MASRKVRHSQRTILLFALLAGCRETEHKTPPPPAPPPQAQQGFTEVHKVALMEQHYVAAIAAHDQLLRGDLDGFRSRMGGLAAQALPSLAPEAWRAGHARMIDAAKEASVAADAGSAGARMGTLVETCGSCHAANLKGPVYRTPLPNPGDGTVSANMRKHQWATERLWEGITGPWDDAWRRGASALAEADYLPPQLRTPALRALEADIRELGKAAMAATTVTQRVEVYGRILAQCGRCHVAADVVFKQP
ncbi:MAG: hypothetical protein IPG96_16835 [Proteobacteria bacterium]|nr:hypothetical protein [Pseudomonadota bacterium]